MKRLVAVVQLIALLCALAFLVLLFANEPADTGLGLRLGSTIRLPAGPLSSGP